MMDVDPTENALRRARASIDKRALGLASGAVAAVVVFAVTAFHVVAAPPGPDLRLLAQYFYGYDVTWRGAFVGAWWSFVAAFVAGWFTAFLHNFVMAAWFVLRRARADLHRLTDFLDHI